MEIMQSKRKSVVLTRDEWNALKKFRNKFNTAIECAEVVGIDRQPLDRILLIGRGSETSVSAIRKILASEVEKERSGLQDNG